MLCEPPTIFNTCNLYDTSNMLKPKLNSYKMNIKRKNTIELIFKQKTCDYVESIGFSFTDSHMMPSIYHINFFRSFFLFFTPGEYYNVIFNLCQQCDTKSLAFGRSTFILGYSPFCIVLKLF